MGKLDGRVAIVTGGAQGIGEGRGRQAGRRGRRPWSWPTSTGRGPRRAAPEGGIGPAGRRLRARRTWPAWSPRPCPGSAGSTCWSTTPRSCPSWPGTTSTTSSGAGSCRSTSTATFLCCLYAQRPMREAGYGRIVNIGSNVFLAGTPNLAHYVASKGGVIAFTRALAREVGPHGITVNAVAPGLTETEGVLASPHAEAFDFVQMLQCLPRRGRRRRHRALGGLPGLRGGRLGHRTAARGRRGDVPQLMAGFAVSARRRHPGRGRRGAVRRLLPRPAGVRRRGGLRRPALRHPGPAPAPACRSPSRATRPRTARGWRWSRRRPGARRRGAGAGGRRRPARSTPSWPAARRRDPGPAVLAALGRPPLLRPGPGRATWSRSSSRREGGGHRPAVSRCDADSPPARRCSWP